MSDEYYTTESNIDTVSSVLAKMGKFRVPISMELRKRIDNPIEAYIEESLPLKIKDPIKRKKKEEILRKNYDNKEDTDNAEALKDKIKEIFDKFDVNKTFDFLSAKEIRYLLRYTALWIDNDLKEYRSQLMKHIQANDNAFKYFKNILQLYIRQYLSLKDSKDFITLYKNVQKKYINNKKHIPDYIQNILDSDLCKDDAANKLASICINEKKRNDISIIEILSKRYKYIRLHTDLFNEIIIKICETCKKDIKNEFYFKLLFEEILSSDINPTQSGKIVSIIISLFDKDVKNNNVSQADLEKIKIKLLRNPYYGDPRITKSEKNWHFVDKNAKHIFITWLAQADLDFFFKIAFKGIVDKHGRKAFWQKYINSHQLVESHVIWSQNHYWMHEIQEEQKRSNIKFKRFENEFECSCFILKFNSIYIVEFSGYGNGVFFYSEEEFGKIVNLQRQLYSKTDDLKQKGKDTRQFSKLDNNIVPNLRVSGAFKIHHAGKWESLVDTALREYGVYKG